MVALSDGYLRVGSSFLVFDMLKDKWTRVGMIDNDAKGNYYLSYRIQPLRKWNSLGISKPVLLELRRIGIERVKIGSSFASTVSSFLSGKTLNSRTEKSVTLHITIEELEKQ